MKQLILCADMEGASGIFEDNASWMRHGSADWLAYGRDCITSNALAVCSAARAKAPTLQPPYPFLLALCEDCVLTQNPASCILCGSPRKQPAGKRRTSQPAWKYSMM